MRMIGKTTTAAVRIGLCHRARRLRKQHLLSQYAGTWKIKDTNGRDFDITLAADGKATAIAPAKPSPDPGRKTAAPR